MSIFKPAVFSSYNLSIIFLFRIQVAEAEYKNSFDEELRSFKERIRKRAAEKVQEAIREAEEEERKARLGPGGLDPVEVYESLPDVSGVIFNPQLNFPYLLTLPQ